MPVYPAETRTGVASVDALIRAMHAVDAPALAGAIVSFNIGCVTEPQGIGGPPLCEDGEPEGTPIEVLPSAYCEGFYARVESMGDSFFEIVRAAPRLFSVYEVEDGEANPNWPRGDYAVVFALAKGGARTVYIGSAGIVNVRYGCAGNAFDHSQEGEVFLLDPPAN